MKRIHLFEFEDYPWFPDVIRRGATDYLRFLIEKLHFYEHAVPFIQKILRKTGKDQILDLCSGGGGGMIQVYDALNKDSQNHITITLTDKYPNLDAFKEITHITGSGIKYISESIDAVTVASSHKEARTMFSAYHHFRPEQAKQILKSAVEAGAPVAFFDGAGNRFVIAMTILLGHPLIFLHATPFIKPFKFSRLFLTYIIPLIPFCTIWDGIASAFRFYNTSEIKAFTEDFSAYSWETGVTKGRMLIKMRYLIGYPKSIAL